MAEGDLCYKSGDGHLIYKTGGDGRLCYKAAAAPGPTAVSLSSGNLALTQTRYGVSWSGYGVGEPCPPDYTTDVLPLYSGTVYPILLADTGTLIGLSTYGSFTGWFDTGPRIYIRLYSYTETYNIWEHLGLTVSSIRLTVSQYGASTDFPSSVFSTGRVYLYSPGSGVPATFGDVSPGTDSYVAISGLGDSGQLSLSTPLVLGSTLRFVVVLDSYQPPSSDGVRSGFSIGSGGITIWVA